MTIPIYQLVFPGGDTNIVANFEYRIPIVGPVTLAYFFDAGVDKLSLPSQLKLNPDAHPAVEPGIPGSRLFGHGRDRARHAKDARFHRPGAASADAGGERAVPAVLGVQSACCSAAICSRPSWPTAPISPTMATFASAVAQFGSTASLPGTARHVPLLRRPDLLRNA